MSDLTVYRDAVIEIKNAVIQSRYRTSISANVEQLTLYYNVGCFVSENTRTGKWGTDAIESISKQLQGELPGVRGFSATSIRNMRIFFEQWRAEFEPNHQLATDELEKRGEHLQLHQLPTEALSPEYIEAFPRVGFTHHIEIISKCKNIHERWYYIKRCAAEFWSVTSLKSHIRADEFNKYGALSNNFSLTIPDSKTASKAVRSFKDEYFFDYVDFDDDEPDERVLEAELISEIKKFIMTFGSGFCFVGDQYRLSVDGEDFFVDLVFFSRDLHSLVAVELKRGKFKPEYLGQLNFYLSALDKFAKRPDENKTIGLLLCKKMSKPVVELAVQDFGKPMGVATYKTGNDIPEQYKSLSPVIDGVQQILSERIAGG
ncbi:MAG: PDDEXK nuclease domain-containing protein [Clostridiales Family XIII bacterium]|jgi:predicted nuclease of restriction endonuclease-like (RecB) superfamily|nr:PDDEXK nuclease domain-containing protein [Clostridiales Family XIII bacterium]